MKITDAMHRTGLSRKAIYVYEERGLISPAKGSQGYRDYSEEDIERLLLIAKLRELDVPLEDIARVLASPGEIDILMQKHLDRLQRDLQDTMQKLSRMQTVLYNLPPNGQLAGLIGAAKVAIPEDMAIASARDLSEDPSLASARRLAMYMNEAFLDVPLDTPERWDAWYRLLEAMDRSSSQLWEGYEECYGGLSAAQQYDDYRFRRELVVGYTKYTPVDEQKKADEILSLLERLRTDEAYRRRWKRYYRLVVFPTIHNPGFTGLDDLLDLLSAVYSKYNAEFNHILRTLVYPRLRSEEGRQLCGELRSVLKETYDISPISMIHFDFWNHTLEKVVGQTLPTDDELRNPGGDAAI